VETPNGSEEEVGHARLARIVTQHRDRSLDDIIRIVLDELRAWSGGEAAHDDVTLVLARAR
jgi:serine phosphatase RsbU (regulator of sigma subunit)